MCPVIMQANKINLNLGNLGSPLFRQLSTSKGSSWTSSAEKLTDPQSQVSLLSKPVQN